MSKLLKLRKKLESKDKNVGFSVIPEWISTGNLALNAIISGNPLRGFPVRRLSFLSGLQGTGKSFLLANAVREAQALGYVCVVMETENSIDEEFMERIGVDLSEDAFMPVSVHSIEEATEIFSEILKAFSREDKVFLFVDSLSNLDTEKDMQKFEDGKVAYGQGLKEKLMKQFARNVASQIGHRNMGCLMNTHLYVSGQDAYGNPKYQPSCGTATLFIPSVGLEIAKKDLKEGKEQVGIKVSAKTYKTRYNLLGQTCEFDLPWDEGMNKYDGLLPFLEAEGVIKKNAAWYSFIDKNGEEVKFQKKNMMDFIEDILDLFEGKEVEEQDETENNVEQMTEGYRGDDNDNDHEG